MGTGYQYDFFLSRRGSVGSVAQEVASILIDKGHKIFVQDYDIPYGSSFVEKMHEGITNCCSLIVLYTGDYFTSPYTRKELWCFVADRADLEERKIVVLRCENVRLRGLLADLVGQDLFGDLGPDERQRRIIAVAEGQPQAQKPGVEAIKAQPGAPRRSSRPFVGVPPRIRTFTGREAEVDRLDAILIGSNKAVVTQLMGRAAVRGMGGVGKTSLAVEYAHRYRDLYDGVWWISAEGSGLLTGLAALGRELGAGEPGETDIDKLARAAVRRLSELSAAWLLIYDNVTRPDDVRDFFPASGANVLITSRFSDWSSWAEEVALDVLPLNEAIAYLQNRVGRSDESGAAALAESVGRLPLALEHAAAYCRGTGLPFASVGREVKRLTDDAPPGVAYPHAISATFSLAIAQAVGQSSVAAHLLAYLAQCAPERIPDDLIRGALEDDGAREKGLLALTGMSLVKIEVDPDGSRSVSMHRLVQTVARERAEVDGSAGTAIGRLIDRIAALFPQEITSETWSIAAKLIPHLLSVLRRVSEEDFNERKEKNSLDRLAKLVVLALLFATEGQREEAAKHIIPDYLARVLGCFYEVEPLSGALDMLIEHHRAEWPRLQQQLLSAENYVLRFAMATALARSCCDKNPPLIEVGDVAGLVDPRKGLSAFELGGYALNLIYAKKYATDPAIINPALLRRLAEHPCYPGRSILGDMMLNLVFQGFKPRAVLTSDRFWKPIWDHVAPDVYMVDAAEPFLLGQKLPGDATVGARQAYDSLTEMDGSRRALLDALPANAAAVAALLRDYFKLGLKTNAIWEARHDITALPDPNEFLRLLFVHPLWSVIESAASVLAEMVRRGDAPIATVTDLFESDDWRYGAIETSYQLRDFDNMASFTGAVHRFYADESCEVRGLCAENIIAEILNLGTEERTRRLRKFEIEIRAWLKDEDCWVLEHLYRLFSELHRSRFDLNWLVSEGRSRLFEDRTEWYALSREEFLRHIEAKKQKIVLDASIPRA
jgi:TIR domain